MLQGERIPIVKENWDTYLVVKTFKKIFGVGAATALKLYDEGYRTLDQLHQVASWRLSPEQQIGLQHVADLDLDIPRQEAEQWRLLVANVVPPGHEVVLLGSYARGIPPDACSDVDICIRSPLYTDDGMTRNGDRTLLVEKIIGQLKQYLFHQFNTTTPTFGAQSKDEWWRSRPDARSFKHRLVMCLGRLTAHHPVRRIDLFQCSSRSWAAMQLYVTGNVWFNRKIREHAEQHGFMLNNAAFGKLSNGVIEPVDVKDERDILEALGVAYIAPSRREY